MQLNNIIETHNIIEKSPFEKMMDNISEIKSEIQQLDAQIYTIQRCQEELINNMIYINAKQQELNVLTGLFMNDVKNINQKITNLSKIIKSDKSNNSAILDNHITIQLQRLKEIITKYQKMQEEYAKKQKNMFSKKCALLDPNIDDTQINKMFDAGVTMQDLKLTNNKNIAEYALADINSRHSTIIGIEKSMRELHEILLQMAILIENQGEQVNIIVDNVNISAQRIATATVDIGQAKLYKSSAARKQMIALFCLFAILIVLALVLLSVVGNYF